MKASGRLTQTVCVWLGLFQARRLSLSPFVPPSRHGRLGQVPARLRHGGGRRVPALKNDSGVQKNLEGGIRRRFERQGRRGHPIRAERLLQLKQLPARPKGGSQEWNSTPQFPATQCAFTFCSPDFTKPAGARPCVESILDNAEGPPVAIRQFLGR
jgi:hypothetical protein